MTKEGQFLNCNWPFEKNMKLHLEGLFGEFVNFGGDFTKFSAFVI